MDRGPAYLSLGETSDMEQRIYGREVDSRHRRGLVETQAVWDLDAVLLGRGDESGERIIAKEYNAVAGLESLDLGASTSDDTSSLEAKSSGGRLDDSHGNQDILVHCC